MYVLLAIVGFIATVSAKDVIVGDGGSLVYEQNVTASPAIWRQVQNLTINAMSPYEVITRIVIIDNREEKNGEAAIVEGGIGHGNVTIELKSPTVFRGYNFEIRVYTKHSDLQVPQTQFVSHQQGDKNQQKSEESDIKSVQVPQTSIVNEQQDVKNQQKTNNSDVQSEQVVKDHQKPNHDDIQTVQVPQTTIVSEEQDVEDEHKNNDIDVQPVLVAQKPIINNQQDVNGQQTIKNTKHDGKELASPEPTITTTIETQAPIGQEKEQHPIVTNKYDNQQVHSQTDNPKQVDEKPLVPTPIDTSKTQNESEQTSSKETKEFNSITNEDWQKMIDQIFGNNVISTEKSLSTSKPVFEETQKTQNPDLIDAEGHLIININGDGYGIENNDELTPTDILSDKETEKKA